MLALKSIPRILLPTHQKQIQYYLLENNFQNGSLDQNCFQKQFSIVQKQKEAETTLCQRDPDFCVNLVEIQFQRRLKFPLLEVFGFARGRTASAFLVFTFDGQIWSVT